MQTAVERVIRSLSLKQPSMAVASNRRDIDGEDRATLFASQLLETYRDRLAARSAEVDLRQQG